MLCLPLLAILSTVAALINPITVNGRHFFDSITKQPFYIKGVDYQPGGSSSSGQNSDPLSDIEICVRDIALFQKLDINTIRVYNINNELNHDECMTALAVAGIYLVLDVNSPVAGHHLNRYEPWTTYTREYMENIFSVVHEFSSYNNTLAFFAGNEIVNDEMSASQSPPYIKAVIRDLKRYIRSNTERLIPVGYSAADDLKYRTSLAQYLECSFRDAADSVDFYGVNTYQWCGQQTFYTSGYNTLVDAYADYSKPIFFSEYGCNTIRPREFDEVRSIYSSDMLHVFSGGLIYEFTEEPNQYGLVKILADGNVQLNPDFHNARKQLLSVQEVFENPILYHGAKPDEPNKQPKCKPAYSNIHIAKQLPQPVANDLIARGVDSRKGKFVRLSPDALSSPYKVFDVDGNSVFMESTTVKPGDNFNPECGYPNGMYKDDCNIEDENDELSEDTLSDLDSEDEYFDSEYDSEYETDEDIDLPKTPGPASRGFISDLLQKINDAFSALFSVKHQ